MFSLAPGLRYPDSISWAKSVSPEGIQETWNHIKTFTLKHGTILKHLSNPNVSILVKREAFSYKRRINVIKQKFSVKIIEKLQGM